jgi:hypothetical protein
MRTRLKNALKEVVRTLEKRPMSYWLTVSFPLAYETEISGKRVQVEVMKLEDTPEYIHLGICVSGGVISDYFPVGTTIIVPKGT